MARLLEPDPQIRCRVRWDAHRAKRTGRERISVALSRRRLSEPDRPEARPGLLRPEPSTVVDVVGIDGAYDRDRPGTVVPDAEVDLAHAAPGAAHHEADEPVVVHDRLLRDAVSGTVVATGRQRRVRLRPHEGRHCQRDEHREDDGERECEGALQHLSVTGNASWTFWLREKKRR